jgi:steroid delta-isomerase-like uncharacterized protein
MLTSPAALIAKYYEAFNAQDMPTFYELVSDDIVHDINQGETEVGKNAFIHFMNKMNQSYKEEIKDIVIMVSKDGNNAAAEFTVHGEYLQSDLGLPPARGQQYVIKAGAFFQIENFKIKRVTVYYNLNDWIKQVSMS